MSINRFAEQTWPDLLSEGCKEYVPGPTHLFPTVVVRKLTLREIDKAQKGIHPRPSGKELNTINTNNIRRHMNENNEQTVNEDAYTPPVTMTSVHSTDDVPDDPCISMTSDIDNIDSDDSDLPDLSNPARKKEKKSEKKEKISDKKRSNDQDKGEKRQKTSDKKTDKIKLDKNVNAENKNKTSDVKKDKIRYEENGKSEKKSNEMVKSKTSEKYNDKNKDKDKLKYSKSSDKRESDKRESDKREIDKRESDKRESDKRESDKRESDKRESDKHRKEKDKLKPNSSEKQDQSDSSMKPREREKEKVSSANTSAKSITENSIPKINSDPSPSAKPKIDLSSFRNKIQEEKVSSANIIAKSITEKPKVDLISFKNKIRDYKKQNSVTQEPKATCNSIQPNTPPVVIKSEPAEITDPSDSMDFQAPLALPDDGEFQSQIDSDQETVAFGDTPEKSRDDEIDKMGNKHSKKKDKIEKRRVSENNDNKDRNKRKRDDSESSSENKRWKSDDSNKKKEKDENKKVRDTSKSETLSSQNNKHVTELAAKSIPPFAAIPTREAEKPASSSMPIPPKSVPVPFAATPVQSVSVSQPVKTPSLDASEPANPSSLSAPDTKEMKRKIAQTFLENSKTKKLERKIKNELEEIKRKIVDIDSKILEEQNELDKTPAEINRICNEDHDDILEMIEKIQENDVLIEDKIKKLEEDKRKLLSEEAEKEKTLRETEAKRNREADEMDSLKASLKMISSRNEGSSSPRPDMVDTNNSKQALISTTPSESSPVTSVITTASGMEQQTQSSSKTATATLPDVSSSVRDMSAKLTPSSSSSPSFAMNKSPNPSVTDVPSSSEDRTCIVKPHKRDDVDDAAAAQATRTEPDPQDSAQDTPLNPTCFLCGKRGEFTCCLGTIYCGEACQEADFDRHQEECKNVSDEED